MERLKIVFLMALVLTFGMGFNVVQAFVTEVETSCDLFDCYTILNTDFNIPPPYIGNIYNSEDLPDTYKHNHIGEILDLQIEVLTKNQVKVFGNIEGATNNLWGLTLLGDNSHENSTWWNSTYQNRLVFNLTNTTTIPANYQMKFEVNASLIPNYTCGTGRWSQNNSLIDFWRIDCNATTTDILEFWIEVPTFDFSNVTFYLHNSSSVNDFSSGTETFLEFDNFDDGSFNTTKWEKFDGSGTFSESGGTITVSGSADGFTSADTFGAIDVCMEFLNFSWTDSGANDNNVIGSNPAGTGEGDEVTYKYQTGASGDHTFSTDGVGTETNTWAWFSGLSGSWTICINASTVDFYSYNGTVGMQHTTEIPDTVWDFGFYRQADISASLNTTFIRLHVYPEPSYNLIGLEYAPPTTTTTTVAPAVRTPMRLPEATQTGLITILVLILLILCLIGFHKN